VAEATHKAATAIRQEFESKTAREREQGDLKKVYDDFAAEHKDFNGLWESGKILDFIQKNPGHNPMSAYLKMTEKEKIAEAVAEARKKTEEEVTKRFLAKQKATVLNGGPASIPRTDEDPALQNTKQHGGLNSVLASKLAEMRRQTGR
jgi:hypothetical protein